MIKYSDLIYCIRTQVSLALSDDASTLILHSHRIDPNSQLAKLVGTRSHTTHAMLYYILVSINEIRGKNVDRTYYMKKVGDMAIWVTIRHCFRRY